MDEKPRKDCVTNDDQQKKNRMDLNSNLPTPQIYSDLPTPQINSDLPTPMISSDLPTPQINSDLPTPMISSDLPTPKISSDLPTPKISSDLPTPQISSDLPAKISCDLPTPQICSDLPTKISCDLPTKSDLSTPKISCDLPTKITSDLPKSLAMNENISDDKKTVVKSEVIDVEDKKPNLNYIASSKMNFDGASMPDQKNFQLSSPGNAKRAKQDSRLPKLVQPQSILPTSSKVTVKKDSTAVQGDARNSNDMKRVVPAPAGRAASTPRPRVDTSIADDDERKMSREGVEETVSEEVFSNYRHNEVVAGCRPHPGDIVEAGSLAAISLPPAVYDLTASIPERVIKDCLLSSLQLEGVLHACQRHRVILPNGNRAGFFIGDGAGVGKGRQIAGVILDNFARGRTKHVWFSISADLIVDAKRDLNDIGCYVKVIEGCKQLDKETRIFGLPSGFKDGVIFSTYATLVSSVQRGTGGISASRQTRLDQLINWCGGKDFEGCLIFDECHKAKNFIPGKEQNSTKIALAVTEIQRILPKARVLYCSATGVSDVKNMAFMERLGLWGDGAPFPSFEQFLDSVQKRGLGVAEMLAMEMKASGLYVSRGLSFRQAEFLSLECNLSSEQIIVYDNATHVWNEVRKALEVAITRTRTTNQRIWASFWGCHQRFFKQLCMCMKVPSIVKEAEESLASGHCIVIGLQTTGEASLESEMSRTGHSVTGFSSLCREILFRFIDEHFPTMIERSQLDDPRDTWCLQAKNMLLEFTTKINLPDSPLDEIVDRLGGPDKVAEMTGRRGRICRRSENDRPHYELREHDGGVDSLNVKERNLFMEGKKLVAIISDAASTGISLHADHRVGNQRRRIHLTIELPWSADKAVQQLGRSHRSNQSSGPLYKLLTTNLGGERRFAAAVARRLLSLGALTKGDRRAATGADLTDFNFDTPYGRSALRTMYNAIIKRELPNGIIESEVIGDCADFQIFSGLLTDCLPLMGIVDSQGHVGQVLKEKDLNDVGKFLNRILGLSVRYQNIIFTYFSKCLENAIQIAKKEGHYNEGLVDLTATSIKIHGVPETIFQDSLSGIETKHKTLIVDRGMSLQVALEKSRKYTGKHDGFYVSRNEVRGHKFYLLAMQRENSTHMFKIARPNTGMSAFDEELSWLNNKYIKVAPHKLESAKEGWNEAYDRMKSECIHGPLCKHGHDCTVGSRCYKVHLLCGGIVSMMALLEASIARFGTKLQLTAAEKSLRVVRCELDGGERIVGVRFPEELIPDVERSLKERRLCEKLRQKGVNTSELPPGVAAAMVQQLMRTNASLLDTSSVAQQTIEPAAPVKPNCLKKATTEPPTMLSFFKVVDKKTHERAVTTGLKNIPTSNNDNDVTGKKSDAKNLTKRRKMDSKSDSIATKDPDWCESAGSRARNSPINPARKQTQISLRQPTPVPVEIVVLSDSEEETENEKKEESTVDEGRTECAATTELAENDSSSSSSAQRRKSARKSLKRNYSQTLDTEDEENEENNDNIKRGDDDDDGTESGTSKMESSANSSSARKSKRGRPRKTAADSDKRKTNANEDSSSRAKKPCGRPRKSND
ncbi:uncharacterized protein LOC141910988 [Tubulanus polymorphus]|uniref:uncharacterized protein LOC141910988 n=1 Tax=Tubulanus polymorphus TaxID=672921 RepID=UPI003DA286A4